MVKVVLSGGWKNLIGHEYTNLILEPGTVREVLQSLTTMFPALRSRIFNKSGNVNSFVNIYVNANDIRFLGNGLDTTCAEDSELAIIPALAGG